MHTTRFAVDALLIRVKCISHAGDAQSELVTPNAARNATKHCALPIDTSFTQKFARGVPFVDCVADGINKFAVVIENCSGIALARVATKGILTIARRSCGTQL